MKTSRNVAAIFLAPVLFAAVPLHAQDVAFKISGEGVAPQALPAPGEAPRPHWIVGEATDLGRHYGQGYVQTDTLNPEVDDNGNLIGFTGQFGSGIDENGDPLPFTFEAANGDELVCVYGRTQFGASQPGEYFLTIVDVLEDGSLVVDALFIAEFVPQPDMSTGQFAGVTGSWIMYAYTEPFVLGSTDPVAYSWDGAGTLTFPKSQAN